MKRVVLIGGGTGTSTLAAAIKKYPCSQSIIVSSADDGGSSGVLRSELGVFPPGDIRQCLLGLGSPDMAELMNYRFTEGSLKGHAFGNILLAALQKTSGGVEEAIEAAKGIFDVHGDIIPVTVKPTLLSAELENGDVVEGEHEIDDPDTTRTSPIAELSLKPNGPANPKALAAIAKADVIVLGPGDLHTSTLPNLLVKGVKEAIIKSKATIVLVTNIMTKHGQTDGFAVSHFIDEVERYLGCGVDVVVANSKYPANNPAYVQLDKKQLAETDVNLIAKPFISSVVHKARKGDPLQRSAVRHDMHKVAKIIYDTIDR